MFGRTLGPRPSGRLYPQAFSDAFRAALDSAASEAARLHHEYIGTEHLLLGLIATGTRGHTLLHSLGIDAAALKNRIEESCKPGLHSGTGTLPYTSRAKKVLELAMTEAEKLRAPVVEFDFLLLGLLMEGKGIAAQLLHASGLSIGRVREPIQMVFESSSSKTPNAAPVTELVASLSVHIYDNSELSITEQIITQIAEAIATGKLKAGERLPTMRHLADKLDIAPGTVARAYGELEQRGAVQTDGARGTTVAPQRAREPLAVAERVLSLSAMLRPIAVEGFHLGKLCKIS